MSRAAGPVGARDAVRRARRTRVAAALCGLAASALALAASASGAPVSEYWDVYARFETGERLFTRFMITDEGPGGRHAVTTGNLVYPDGTVVPFRKGKLDGEWSQSADGRRLKIGKGVLDRSAPVHELRFGSEKFGIDLALRFEPAGPVVDGNAGAPAGYASELLEMGTAVEGWYRVASMDAPRSVRGTLALTHTATSRSEADLALRRIEFLSLREGSALYLSDLTAPDGSRTRWIAVRRDGGILYRSEDFELGWTANSPQVGDPAYPFPDALEIRNGDLRGEIRLANVLARQDLFEGLPLPFRLLLTLRMRPHRVWTDSPFEVELQAAPDAPPFELRGTGITSVTFLNPIPSPA